MFDLSGLYQGSEEHSIQEDTSAPLSLNVRVLMKTRFRSVVSPSHDIQAEMKEEKGGEFEAGLKFAGDTSALDRDIVLLIQCEEPNKPIVDAVHIFPTSCLEFKEASTPPR